MSIYGAGLEPVRSEEQFRIEVLGNNNWVTLCWDSDETFVMEMCHELQEQNETFRLIECGGDFAENVMWEYFAPEIEPPRDPLDDLCVEWWREGF